MNINTRANGQTSGSAIFRDSTLNIALKNNALGMSGKCAIIIIKNKVIESIKQNWTKYYKMIFDYRLLHAKRVVKNVFGILIWRFRIFSYPINLTSETTEKVIHAESSLHN